MKKTLKTLLVLFFLTSCQSTQDAFTLKKKSSSDEFLVEKKSPLVLPPEYGKLPVPQNSKENIQQNDNDNDLKDLLSNKKNKKTSDVEQKANTTSIKKSILEKIQ